MENVKETEKNEWLQAVLKLIGLTQKKNIQWKPFSVESVPSRGMDGEKVHIAFCTNHLGRTLLLTQISYTYSLPEDMYMIQLRASAVHKSKPPERARRSVITLLSLLDKQGNVVYNVPQVEALEHLLQEVKLQQVDVRGYLDALLSEK